MAIIMPFAINFRRDGHAYEVLLAPRFSMTTLLGFEGEKQEKVRTDGK